MGDFPEITHALGYIDRAASSRGVEVGLGAGNRRNAGAIDRCISFSGDPAIRASLLNGEFPYKWELCARNWLLDVLTKRAAKRRDGRIA